MTPDRYTAILRGVNYALEHMPYQEDANHLQGTQAFRDLAEICRHLRKAKARLTTIARKEAPS